jgi:hypothetical protein
LFILPSRARRLVHEALKAKNTGDEDDLFDLNQVLEDFYGSEGTKQELLLNVEPPDFDKADIIDIYRDFDPCR